MIAVKVKYNGKKVKLVGDGPGKYAWFQAGQQAIRTIRDRVARAQGSDDSPMPALSGRGSAVTRDGKFLRQRPGYREQKQRSGGKGIRDLYGTGKQGGHMLDALRVTEAGPSYVKMSITTRWGRIKARANEQRAPWFGFSTKDGRKVLGDLIEMHRDTVIAVAAKVRGGRTVRAAV